MVDRLINEAYCEVYWDSLRERNEAESAALAKRCRVIQQQAVTARQVESVVFDAELPEVRSRAVAQGQGQRVAVGSNLIPVAGLRGTMLGTALKRM